MKNLKENKEFQNEYCMNTEFKASSEAADHNMKRLASMQNLSKDILEKRILYTPTKPHNEVYNNKYIEKVR